ncbi:hypothetical protein FISHEDRAFT_5801, partial [Fistulina hepatica ATCC 64428]
MRMSSRLALAALCIQLAAARLLHSLPDDPYAFPKFRTVFLNDQPLSNATAQRWLKDGLRGGELEFTDQPWQDTPTPPSWREIDGGSDAAPQHLLQSAADERSYSLELMKMGKDSYLCYIPKPPETTASQADDVADIEMTPARSWSLLQPLTGTCLYHRQGWFTYSYCHNQEIRQFKELVQAQPHNRGKCFLYKPQEDPEWHSYTLGRAPKTPEPGADLTVAEQHALATNLELARNAGSRYLVQRWGDGTICDKTGRPREVEVQFHCSMAMTDTILFVKEAKTCSYVLVIHTPRLCGEPGFKSRKEASEETVIQCREVLSGNDMGYANKGKALPPVDYPQKLPRPTHKPIPPKPSPESKEGAYNDIFRKALEAIIGNKGDLELGDVIMENGDMIIEVIDDGFDDSDGSNAKLADVLRSAGFEVKTGAAT